MKCPNCGGSDSSVIETRSAEEGASLRRRRECLTCHIRFTTYERVERIPIMVVKQGGNRVAFDRERVLSGMMRACEKRPVPVERLEEAADRIDKHVRSMGVHEIPSKYIGQLVEEELKQIDHVAYVRFASVYQKFATIDEFGQIIERLQTGQQS